MQGVIPVTTLNTDNFGYEQVAGVKFAYLVKDGLRMSALAEVFSNILHDIPRTTVHKRLEYLGITKYSCSSGDLRKLKALNAIPQHTAMCTLIATKDVHRLYHSCKNEPTLRTKVRKTRSSESNINTTTISHFNLKQSLKIFNGKREKTIGFSNSNTNSNVNATHMRSCSRSHNSWVLKPSKLTSLSRMPVPAFPMYAKKYNSPAFQQLGTESTGFHMHVFGNDIPAFRGDNHTMVGTGMAAITMKNTAKHVGLADSGNATTSMRSIATNTQTPFKMAANTTTYVAHRPASNPKFMFSKDGAKSANTEEIRFVNGFQYDSGIRLKSRDGYDTYDDSDSDLSTLEIDSNISSISALTTSHDESVSNSNSSYSDSSDSSDTDSLSSSSSSSSCSSDMSVCNSRYNAKAHHFAANDFTKVTDYTSTHSNTTPMENNSVILFKSLGKDKINDKNNGKSECRFTALTGNIPEECTPKTPLSPSTNSLILKKREQQWTVETCTVAKITSTTAKTSAKTSSCSQQLESIPPVVKVLSSNKKKKNKFKKEMKNSKCKPKSRKVSTSISDRSKTAVNCEGKCATKSLEDKEEPRQPREKNESSTKLSRSRQREISRNDGPPKKKRKLVGKVPNGKCTEVVEKKRGFGKSTFKKTSLDSGIDVKNSIKNFDKLDTLTCPVKSKKKTKYKEGKKGKEKKWKKLGKCLSEESPVINSEIVNDVSTLSKSKRIRRSVTPGRTTFNFLDNFPLVPSLVVRNGDLEPAVSMRVDLNHPPAKGHPIWKWKLGGPPLPCTGNRPGKGMGRGKKRQRRKCVSACEANLPC